MKDSIETIRAKYILASERSHQIMAEAALIDRTNRDVIISWARRHWTALADVLRLQVTILEYGIAELDKGEVFFIPDFFPEEGL